MDIVIVLQVITVIVSVSSIVISVILTVKENSVKHFLNYTTNFRINTLLKVRTKMITLLNLTNPVIINSYSDADKKDYLRELYDASLEIELIYKEIYSEEFEMVILIRELTVLATEYFQNRGDIELINSIRETTNKLKYLYSIYETTDWEFIKKQTYGKPMDNKEFLETYEKYKVKFEQANHE